jgi:hypothetical protein
MWVKRNVFGCCGNYLHSSQESLITLKVDRATSKTAHYRGVSITDEYSPAHCGGVFIYDQRYDNLRCLRYALCIHQLQG